jgi:hypothetical protein
VLPPCCCRRASRTRRQQLKLSCARSAKTSEIRHTNFSRLPRIANPFSMPQPTHLHAITTDFPRLRPPTFWPRTAAQCPMSATAGHSRCLHRVTTCTHICNTFIHLRCQHAATASDLKSISLLPSPCRDCVLLLVGHVCWAWTSFLVTAHVVAELESTSRLP